ncbi:MAG: 4Fe-4S binding protein [Oscillospiraceae bacterium]|nr:4Fe-4S binding protein [Oscillospiraceae bacterium]
MGGLQIRMPDSVCDSKALKKSKVENHRIVMEADIKIEQAAEQVKTGQYLREGLNFVLHIKGLLGQCLSFYGKTAYDSDKLKINSDCTACGLCAGNCPTKNIKMADGMPIAGNHYTMCYRCISHCLLC